VIELERFHAGIFPALLVIALATACGNGASTQTPDADGAPAGGGCSSGQFYCMACGGGGFCSEACPMIDCPAGDGAAGGDAAVVDGGGADGGCPSGASTSCVDCNGGEFCVSGACPLATCPARDGGVSSFQGVCPGASPPLAGYPVCRSSADCVGVSFCAEQPVGGCGVCVGVEHACTTDSDCLPVGAMVCEPYVETSPCLCNGASNGTRCVPKCPGNACDADSQCSATGHCLPTPCSQGYTCPSDLACKPGDASADVHGCGTKLCTEGFTCAADQTCDQSAPQADVHRCAPAPCSSGYACPTGWRCAAGTGSDAH
jgi:hypothetical protein